MIGRKFVQMKIFGIYAQLLAVQCSMILNTVYIPLQALLQKRGKSLMRVAQTTYTFIAMHAHYTCI